MGLRTCARQNRLALDVLLAAFFVLLDTVSTLAGTSWWPAHPGTLAWAMLVVQGLADASLVFRRRAPMLVIAILGGFTLVISLLISPAGLITPENAENVWAPYGTILAAYGPFYYRRDRRAAFAAVGTLTLIVARVWEPTVSVITIGVLRTAVGPTTRALLHRAARGPAGSTRPGRTRRAGALPARRAGQGRGKGPARGRNARRRRNAPGQPDGAWQAGALSITAKEETTRGRPRKNCGPRAARRWMSCGIWSASCGPSPIATRRRQPRACPR